MKQRNKEEMTKIKKIQAQQRKNNKKQKAQRIKIKEDRATKSLLNIPSVHKCSVLNAAIS